MVTQSKEYVKKCIRCQKHASLIHQPAFPLNMITSPWPFAVWAFDIVGKMPKAPGGFEYMLTATDLFTKWVEAALLVHTIAGDMERFIRKHIISRFSMPYAILSDNDTQFVAVAIKAFYKKHNITIQNSSIAYPQGNRPRPPTRLSLRGSSEGWIESSANGLTNYLTSYGHIVLLHEDQLAERHSLWPTVWKPFYHWQP